VTRRGRAAAVAIPPRAGAGAGVFGVETFLLPDGRVLLNEVAPRPHNSGHYTIEACASSQFEAHLRAVLGWPLGDTGLRVGAAIMLNILGEASGEEGERRAHALMAAALRVPGASVHWYGKAGVAPQRKVGHITVVGRDNEEVRQRLRLIDPSESWRRGRGGRSAAALGQVPAGWRARARQQAPSLLCASRCPRPAHLNLGTHPHAQVPPTRLRPPARSWRLSCRRGVAAPPPAPPWASSWDPTPTCPPCAPPPRCWRSLGWRAR
jgi:hypothetical protein